MKAFVQKRLCSPCSLRLESLQIDTMALNGTLGIELGKPLTFFMFLLLLD